MRPDLEAVIIADDLTGAADTGVQLTGSGSPVYLLPIESLSSGHSWMAMAGSLSIYTATRALSPQAAAARLRLVADALPGLHPRWIYKKIDSSLRGNIGVEIDALLEALELDAALVAPALPAQGRTTIGGIQLVNGRPLVESEFAKDRLRPVTCSAVAEILAGQSRYPIGQIGVKEYGDLKRLQRAVQQEREHGCRLIVCDAAEQVHLDQVAILAAQSAGRLLPVGSAGLAGSLVGRRVQGESSPTIIGASDCDAYFGRLLLVYGTRSHITRRQVDALLERYPGVCCELEPEWLLEASAEDRRSCAGRLFESWSGGILVLGIRPLSPSGPKVTPSQARTGLAVFAELAMEVLRASRVDGLYLLLSGGETAEAFRRVSGGEAVALEREVLPGLVLGRWLGGVANGLPVITKAGAFGHEQTLIALYERLSGGAGA